MTVFDALSTITLQALATAVALALSVFTFARQELGKRAAELTVTCERVPEEKTTRTYVVVHNSGSATARVVDVNFIDETRTPTRDGLRIFGVPVDIPPGHAARLDYWRTLGSDNHSVKVEWTDKRRGTHKLVVPLNERSVPGTPVVHIDVHTQDPPSGPRPARRGMGR